MRTQTTISFTIIHIYHSTYCMLMVSSEAQELCVLLIVFFICSDALQNWGTSSSIAFILSYIHKILFRFLVRKTILIKTQHFIFQVRMCSQLNLCITCQSARLWAGSRLPWIFIFWKVNLLKLLLWAISEWIKKENLCWRRTIPEEVGDWALKD